MFIVYVPVKWARSKNRLLYSFKFEDYFNNKRIFKKIFFSPYFYKQVTNFYCVVSFRDEQNKRRYLCVFGDGIFREKKNMCSCQRARWIWFIELFSFIASFPLLQCEFPAKHPMPDFLFFPKTSFYLTANE